MMDYAERLRIEARGAHAQFHEYALIVGGAPSDYVFLFFEGEDDPIFYNNFIIPRLVGRGYREFVCLGRSEVLRAHEMVARDGRSNGRALFFIDKDHSNIVDPKFTPPSSVYQTDVYSFENYLVCFEVFRRFWVERLRLPLSDKRFDLWHARLTSLHGGFMRRSRVLMALVLIGRGVEGGGSVKLNLNNANLKNVFDIRFYDDIGSVRWRRGGGRGFVAAVNLEGSKISMSRIKSISKNYLQGEPKGYVRGKYEAWVFVKFLQEMTRVLSDKAANVATGEKRAKPVEMVSESNFVSMVASLVPCPNSLMEFLDEVLPARAAA